MNLSALVLAAGQGRRFGGDKLLRPFRGAPLFMHAVRAACAAPVDRIAIVARPDVEMDRHCRAAIEQDERIIAVNIESAALSDSLRAGLAAIEEDSAAFIFLGDMPLVPLHVAALLAERLGGRFAAVPTCEGRPGHPVLLSARAAALAAQLTGDRGAGALVRKNEGDVAFIETHDERVVFDVDTAEDYDRLSQRGEE